MIFLIVDDSFFFQFADLGRESASLDLKIVCKLLTVKGYIKAVTVAFFCLQRKIRQKLFVRGALGGDLYALMKHYSFCGKVLHKIEDELLMKAAVVGTGVKNMVTVYKHYLAGLVSYDRHGQCLHLSAGECLGKYVRGVYFGEYTAIAVVIYLYHLYRPRKHDADIFGGCAFGKDGVFFVEGLNSCAKTSQHFYKVVVVNAFEKRTFF